MRQDELFPLLVRYFWHKLSSEDINWGKHLKLHVEVSSWRERERYVVGNGISNNDKGYTTRWSISYRVSNMVYPSTV